MTLGVVRRVVAGGFLTTTRNAGDDRSGCDQEPVTADTTQELMKKSVHSPYDGLILLPKSLRRVDKWPAGDRLPRQPGTAPGRHEHGA
jgi:hypothetical protein